MLPNGLNLRSPNACIPTDQWKFQSQRGGGNDPVRHIRNLVPADKLDRIHNRPIHGYKPRRSFWIIQRFDQTLSGGSRQSILFDQVYEFHKADSRNVDGISVLGRGIKRFRSLFRKLWISREVPNDRVGIGNDRRHQNSRGKFFHISRWFSSISSAVSVMFKSAQRPLMLLNGFLGAASTRIWLACSKSSFCFSGGSDRTASMMDCSRVIIRLHSIIAGSRRAARREAWSK
jgi:hypothetical protein